MTSRTKRFLSISLLSLLTADAIGCSYHNGPRFGMYARQNPVMQFHPVKKTTSEFSLTHLSQVSASVNAANLLEVKYLNPKPFQDMVLQIKGSRGLEIKQSSEQKLNTYRGTIPFIYVAKQAGQHQIEIRAEGLKNGAPFSLVQKVQVNANL